MNSSLSVLLPVRDAQSTLSRDVAALLDLLPELAARFDVWIVDDGSTDATAEVAQDLAQRYPQVHLIENAAPAGLAESIRLGLSQTRGDYLLIHDAAERIRLDHVSSLWRRRNEEEGVISPPSNGRGFQPSVWFSRLLPARQRGGRRTGFHLLRRDRLQSLLPDIPVPAPATLKRGRVFSGLALRQDQARPVAAATTRPNYLQRLRNFTLSE